MLTNAYRRERLQMMASTAAATDVGSDATLLLSNRVRVGDFRPFPLRERRGKWGRTFRCWLTVGCLMLINLTSCRATVGHVIGQQFVSSVYAFAVPLPEDTWQPVRHEPSVLTLAHTQLAAGITISVTCEQARDVPLDILTRHLFFGFKDMQVLQQAPQALNGVPALKTIARAHLDGREVQLHGYVVQHNGCIYDLVYFASPLDYSRGEASFEGMVAGFRFLQR